MLTLDLLCTDLGSYFCLESMPCAIAKQLLSLPMLREGLMGGECHENLNFTCAGICCKLKTFAGSYLWAQGRTIVKCEASNVQFREVHSDVSNMDFFLTWRVGCPCWL